jgi:Rnl2 family RNA ligase
MSDDIYNKPDKAGRKQQIHKLDRNGLLDGEWVACEKIDGETFSFWFDGTEHKQATKDGFTSVGYCSNIMKYRTQIALIYHYLERQQAIENGDHLTIYGELLGGFYRGDMGINSRVISEDAPDYHPDNEFMAFDIKVNDKFLPFMDLESLCRRFELPLAPVLYYGSFDDVINIPNEFSSYVPEDLGLTYIEGNIGEGLIVRPYIDERLTPSLQRVIIKSQHNEDED